MEEKFYLDDFELSLKEHANQFKMAPSKKVWQGIYNDLHPGRRWPSVMMSLLLISSVIFIGYINTHADKKLVDSKSLPLEKNEKKDALLKSQSADKNYQTSTKQIDFKYDKTISYKQNKTNEGSISFTPILSFEVLILSEVF